GYTVEEVMGRTPRILQGPKTDRAVLDDLRHRLEQGQGFHGEAINYRKDGTEFILEWMITPIHDESGATTHFIAIQRDITERKQAEAALQAAKQEAEAANRAKSEFLSRMSHELRTPLNAILGFTQLMALDERPPRERQNLDYILKAGQHLLALINEVLDIARIESGHMSFSIEPVQVHEMLQETVDLARPLAADCNVRLHEAQGCDHWVLADRQRLKQVLLNLLSNAIKYNRQDGQVMVLCEQIEDRGSRMEDRHGSHAEAAQAVLDPPSSILHPQPLLRIAVRDTGSGIAPELQERLFTAFDRLGAEHTGIEGTGIGLALSKRLIEAMGGRIGVESAVHEGSTFWVDLPLVENHAGRAGTGEETPASAAATVPATVRTILYIEDNLSNLHLIESILSQHPGIRLLAAMQGGLGLDLAREHQPASILLDLHLPDMPGDEVLRRLQADAATRAIPVIVLSADATPGRIERLLASGARAYLTKPLQVRQFLQTLEETLAK
ncbi:MAG: ATP-binding protein, partial [Armatimonadota bacterium]|nr:ATP-binding protein [Armatimonadota bacterium]